MRLTNQMLQQSAAKAGLSMNTTTLMDYVKSDSPTSLLSKVSSANSNANTLKKNNYEKLEEGSSKLVDALTEVEKSVTDSNTEEIYKNVENMVDAYNSTVDGMKLLTGALDTFYKTQLNELSGSEKEALEKIGITIESDGTLSLSTNKLKQASTEDISAVFGKDSKFQDKLLYVADKINDNATANLESLTNQYTANGANAYQQTASKFNIKG